MKNENLKFNVLSFDYPKEKIKLYFSTEESGYCTRLHKTLFPNDIKKIFPELDKETDFNYTTWDKDVGDFEALKIDFKKENPDLIKKFYDRKINFYFKIVLKEIVKVGFVGENQIWIYNENNSDENYNAYSKFALKVHIKEVSEYPEILLSYEGVSKVFKKSVSELVDDISPTCFNWVLKDNKLIKYKKIREDNPDLKTFFPVLNKNIENALGLRPEFGGLKNRYEVYLKSIEWFFKHYLNTDEFKRFIPLNSSGFLKVKPAIIGNTSYHSNDLKFNTGNHKIPYLGVKELNPYKSSPHRNIHLFFIMHKDNVADSKKIYKAFKEGFGSFRGLEDFANITFNVERNFSIKFTNKENPLPEIESELLERNLNADVQYIAIYLTPYSKDVSDINKRKIYYKVKESLLKRKVTSQVIDPVKMNVQGQNWVYSLPNIAIAILAKLDGIPWRLDTTLKNELVIGVGAFKHIDEGVQYIGSAFSFSNIGQFNNFEYFTKDEINLFAGKVAHEVRNYASSVEKPDRLIIHFYKTMSKREISYIERALHNLGLDIDVFIVSINKTESNDIVAFDKNWYGYMPRSGSFINIGGNKYLLFNNTRYSNATINKMDGYPFPIKLKIDCTNKDELQNTKVIEELIDQVYQFSRMYWKSVRQQNLPVTIKYPEIIAQMAPYFEGNDIPDYGKRSLWFL